MQVISIGTNINRLKRQELTITDLFSDVTFLDADIIFWDLKYSFDILSPKGVNPINKKLYFKYVKSIEKRNYTC